MIRDTAVQQILKQMGQRQNDSIAREDTIAELSNAQDRLERGVIQPWFLLQLYTHAAFVTVQDLNTVALPATFLREVDDEGGGDVGSLWYYHEDKWKLVYKEEYSIAQRKYGSMVPGKPQRYCLIGNDIMLFPAADGVYPLRLLAAYQQTSIFGTYGDVATNIENTWLKYAADLLMGEAGRILAGGYYRDVDAKAHFELMTASGSKRVYDETIARIEAGMLRAMGV